MVRRHLVEARLASGFDSLAAHGVIEESTRRALGRAAGLRNVVANGYGSVDVAVVHTASVTGVEDLRAFARQVAAWLERDRG